MNFTTVTSPMHIINYCKTVSPQDAIGILQEECAELIQALSKLNRVGTPDDPRYIKVQQNICEEVAHVLISIDALTELCPKLVEYNQVMSYVKVKEAALATQMGDKYDTDIAVAGV